MKRRGWLIALCVMALMVGAFYGAASFNARQAAQEQLNEIEQRNDALEKQIELSQTDEYIVRMARQILGWVFPGEIRIIEGTEP